MVRIYLTCDICGDKWDITDTDYAIRAAYQGTKYIHECVKKGVRTMILQKAKVTDDDRLERDDLDICDKCYNKIDRFIYEIGKGDKE